VKAILLRKHGRPEILSFVEVWEPVPERDHALMESRASVGKIVIHH